MVVISWTMRKSKEKMNSPKTSDDVLIEILKRIPGKTLTRFRCVSKHWNHLIHCRPDFATVHYNYWKTLAAAPTTPTLVLFLVSHQMKRIFYIINNEGEAQHHLTIDTSKFGFKTHHCSTPQSINGIFCLFDFHHVLVCNIATGEIISLPVSSLASNYRYMPTYFFGYDPVNNEYKVLCVWTNDQDSSTAESEVFTVGISRAWRKIDTLPCDSKNLCRESVCVNGIIYWVTDLYGVKRSLVSFNVKDEKFQITELPQNRWGGRLAQVVQFKGHVAIVNPGKSELLMLDDDADEFRIHDFEKDFEFPSKHSDLVITSNSERFFVLNGIIYPYLRLVHYKNDDIVLLKSTRITGLDVATYGCSGQSAIYEHVENIYPLARN